MKSVLLTCAAIIYACYATTTYAGHEPVPAVATPMVVTANRLDLSVDQAVAPVVVVDRATIVRSQAMDVAALLQTVPGVDVARNGGPGQQTSVFMRGANSNQTRVLLNGVPINPGTAGGAALQNIGISTVQRIDIIKGPRSSLYGSGAIGGIINIVTRKPQPGAQLDVRLKAGQYRTRAGSASLSGANEEWAGIASISRNTTAGFPPRIASNIDSGYDNTTVNVYGQWRDDAVSVSGEHWQTAGTNDYLNFALLPTSQHFSNRITTATVAATPTKHWHTNVTLNHFRGAIDQIDTTDYQRTDRYSVDWQNNMTITRHNRLVAGVHFDYAKTASRSIGTVFGESHSARAIYIQNDTVIGLHHFLIAARDTDDDRFGNHLTGNIDYGYQLTDATRLTAGYGTAFHAPTSVQRFGFGANPGLEAEKSQSVELGLRQRLGKNQQLTASLYQNDINNLIVYDDPDGFLGPLPGQNQNIDRSRIRGLEVRYTLGYNHWQWQAGASISDPRNQLTNNALARRSRRSFSSELDYLFGPHVIGVQLYATGARKDSAFSNIIDAGYGLINLTSRFFIASQWSLYAKISNLFDNDYQSVAGYRTPGRSVYLTLKYSWQS